jgi:hypothetical protein
VLKILRPDERPDQVDQQPRGNGGAQDEVEHRLDPLTQSGVEGHQENAPCAEDNDEDIEHGVPSVQPGCSAGLFNRAVRSSVAWRGAVVIQRGIKRPY